MCHNNSAIKHPRVKHPGVTSLNTVRCPYMYGKHVNKKEQ